MSTQAPRRPAVPSRAALEARANRRRYVAIGSVVVLAIVVIVAISLANRVPKTASDAPIDAVLNVGDKAPDFTVSTTGGPFQLSNAGAKPTLLEVFATWCPHCQREAPILSTLYAKYKSRVNFVGVAGSPYGMDQQPETQNDVVDFTQKFGARYPVAFDPNLDVAKKYLQGGFPTVVLIGADGKVQAVRSGEMPPTDITAGIDASLAGKKPDPKLGAKG